MHVSAGQVDVCLVNQERPESVEENPFVAFHVRNVGHLVCLRKDWHLAVEISRMQARRSMIFCS